MGNSLLLEQVTSLLQIFEDQGFFSVFRSIIQVAYRGNESSLPVT
jgi:hypothetical protein